MRLIILDIPCLRARQAMKLLSAKGDKLVYGARVHAKTAIDEWAQLAAQETSQFVANWIATQLIDFITIMVNHCLKDAEKGLSSEEANDFSTTAVPLTRQGSLPRSQGLPVDEWPAAAASLLRDCVCRCLQILPGSPVPGDLGEDLQTVLQELLAECRRTSLPSYALLDALRVSGELCVELLMRAAEPTTEDMCTLDASVLAIIDIWQHFARREGLTGEITAVVGLVGLVEGGVVLILLTLLSFLVFL